MKLRLSMLSLVVAIIAFTFTGCKKDEDNNNDNNMNTEQPTDPDTAPKASIDRFSDAAATLMKRSEHSGLPAANAAINYDMAPFITKGLGPSGEMVEYYNFDVQSVDPAPIYVLFKEGASTPVPNQLNIIDVIPGDNGYNDFWEVQKVTVPSDYVANTVTSKQEIMDKGYPVEETKTLVNCPVVPEGSTASKGGGSNGLTRGWYKDKIVFYFSFEEKALTTTSNDKIPLSPIYVAFNKNPDPNDPTSGPASGFMTEMGTMQTHNVVKTIPSDSDYSPFWLVNVYDNADFNMVMDFQSAQSANILATGVATVNCPIVTVQ